MARLQHYEMRSRSYGAHTALGQLSWRNRASPTGRDHQIYKHQGRGVEQFGFGYSHARSHALCLPSRPDRQRYAGGRAHACLHRFTVYGNDYWSEVGMDDFKFLSFMLLKTMATLGLTAIPC